MRFKKFLCNENRSAAARLATGVGVKRRGISFDLCPFAVMKKCQQRQTFLFNRRNLRAKRSEETEIFGIGISRKGRLETRQVVQKGDGAATQGDERWVWLAERAEQGDLV